MSHIFKTVCFVCYGNICRSPMAVAIMSDIIQKIPSLDQKDIKICSAGTDAMRGQVAHPNARETMKEWGLNLDHHLSSPLSGGIIEGADLIVALDNYISEDITTYYPSSVGKMCTLNITDPYGQSLEVFRRCAEGIRDSCLLKVLPLITLWQHSD